MHPFELPHFQESSGDRAPLPADALLPTSVYAQVLDHIVIACVDLVLTCEGQVCLAHRRRLPRLGWWVIGGRMRSGEDPITSAQRKAAQEAHLLDLTRDRFRLMGVYSTCFAMRSQEPQSNGVHSLNVTYQVELTRSEAETVQLESGEYSGWQWMTRREAEQLLDVTTVMDQVLMQLLRDSSNLDG